MEQILLYWWLFVALVVELVDGVFEWLRPHGFSSSVFLFAIFTAGSFIIFNKWSVGVDLRIQAIEDKLGIEHQPRRETKKITWWAPLLWVAAAAYLTGKSLGSEGFGFFVGTVISGFMSLIFVFSGYCLLDQTMRDYFRKPNPIPNHIREDIE